jgi:hypothetical protein
MVRLDTFVSSIRDGTVLNDVDFKLLAHDKTGKIKILRFKGVCLICNNGYLSWSCTVPPFSKSNDIDEMHWSKWLESMRKDVECTFGILKGRWRILKSGVRISGVDAVDYVWFTCCTLHKWLLDIDGLSEKWVGGVGQCVSDWEGELGGIKFDGIHKDIPNALARLSENLDPRNYDSSGLGPGLDVIGETRTIFTKEIRDYAGNEILKQICVGEDRVRHVKFLSLAVFRRLLVNHFAILFSQNKIVWPTRKRKRRRE